MKPSKIKNLICFRGITGSHAYGTSIPTSDIDERGIFVWPIKNRLSLFSVEPEASSELNEETGEKEDVKYFDLHKFMTLANKATPNAIELLWLPGDCVYFCDDRMKLLIKNRNAFMTKQALDTHSCYAFAQIKKARGQNKLVHNPKPVEKPTREQFCYFIPAGSHRHDTIPLLETGIDLSICKVTAIPHLKDAYHLFPGGNGVFKGDMLVCESVPESERNHVAGMLIFQEDGWKKEVIDWKHYWDWMKERNPKRWEDQEKNGVDFDAKNMLHTIRLMFLSESIIEKGEPIIRFSGDTLAFLRKIRENAFSYEYLLSFAEEKMAKIDSLRASCTLPEKVDEVFVDNLYRTILEMS